MTQSEAVDTEPSRWWPELLPQGTRPGKRGVGRKLGLFQDPDPFQLGVH